MTKIWAQRAIRGFAVLPAISKLITVSEVGLRLDVGVSWVPGLALAPHALYQAVIAALPWTVVTTPLGLAAVYGVRREHCSKAAVVDLGHRSAPASSKTEGAP